jgi:hypothetical protein
MPCQRFALLLEVVLALVDRAASKAARAASSGLAVAGGLWPRFGARLPEEFELVGQLALDALARAGLLPSLLAHGLDGMERGLRGGSAPDVPAAVQGAVAELEKRSHAWQTLGWRLLHRHATRLCWWCGAPRRGCREAGGCAAEQARRVDPRL